MQARWSTATPRIDDRLNDIRFCISMHALDSCYLWRFLLQSLLGWKQLPLD